MVSRVSRRATRGPRRPHGLLAGALLLAALALAAAWQPAAASPATAAAAAWPWPPGPAPPGGPDVRSEWEKTLTILWERSKDAVGFCVGDSQVRWRPLS